jgi:hypothetical protein
LARWADRFAGLGVMGRIAAAGLVAPALVSAATQAQPHPWAVRAVEAAALGSVSGKAPAVKGIDQGRVTLSNRGFVYTASFAADGAFRFPSVEAGTYALTTEITGYNLTKTVSVEVAAGAAVSVPDLAIETYTVANNTYSYTWKQDQAYAGLPKTEIAENVVKPTVVNVIGKAYTMADVSYAQELMNRYGIVLVNDEAAWTQEYAYRLFAVLSRIPQKMGTDYKFDSSLPTRRWTLTTDFINEDIDLSRLASGEVRVSTAAFTYAAPVVVEIEGVRGLYFSKRLHHALVRYVTNGGTDQAAVAKILWDRYGLLIDRDGAPLQYSQFTSEPATRFQQWFKHPDELIRVINAFEELPEGFHKIAGFKWLVRRLDGTVNPLLPEAPAIAWGNGYMEYMEVAFSNFDESYMTRLILHEKAHYIYQFIVEKALKKTWAELGGWVYAPNPTNPDYDDITGWQTTKTTEFVSAYAHDKNPNEDFAESIAAYVNNPDRLKARSMAKYEFIRDNVMHSNSYVSIIRPDLTFTVLNLFPSYEYPGKINRISTRVSGAPEEDKTLEVEIEITPLAFAGNRAEAIQGRILSPVSPEAPIATFFDMWFSRVDEKGTIFRGTQKLSKHVRNGYWQMPNVRIIDTVGRERYESSLLYGFKCYINNPLQDLQIPQVKRGSTTISLRSDTLQGRPVQWVTIGWDTVENTGLTSYFATLVPPDAYSLQAYGNRTVANGRTEVEILINEFMPTGRYTVNQIRLSDLGLNASYTYFRTSPFNFGNSDGLVDQLDEPAPSIEIKTPNPDLVGPELDVNRITVKAQPTNTVTPDGETLVTIDYYVRDNASGYGGGSHLKLRDPQGGEHFFWIGHRNASTRFFDGDPKAWEKYTFETLLPRGSVPGTWGLLQMTLSDKANNLKSYSFLETVRFDPNSTAAADLNITGDPVGQSYRTGETIRLSVQTAGSAKVSYEWFKDGVSLAAASDAAGISGARTAQLTVANAQAADAGAYYCVVTNDAGRVVSKAADVRYDPVGSRLGNVSLRATLAARQPLIVGLTMSGGAKPVLMRAVGPGLAPFGVTNAMPDPTLGLFEGTQLVATNDNWTGESALVSTAAAVGAFPLTAGSKDAVLLRSFADGRTLQVQGAVGGNVLVEAYDASSGSFPRLTNVSARNFAGAGEEALIAGFSILGTEPKRVLVRAVGPTLSAFGVAGALGDPKLDVYAGSNRIAGNDNWPASLASTFSAVGAFALPVGSRDAAVELTLAPGGYTVHVSPATGVAGEVLIEIYELP